MADFVHLHLHTEWSLLDGAIRVKDLPQKLEEYKMPGCAITDHGTLFGIIHFYKTLKDAGFKPLIGCEFYVAEGSRFNKKTSKRGDTGYHLVLIAKNYQGYKNLLKLATIAYLEGFYYKPRIDKEVLAQYKEGLICLSACLEGEIPRLFLEGKKEKARETAKWFKDVFGEDFYLELQRNDLEEQEKVNAFLLELGEDLGIKTVATADCHYLNKEDVKAHDVLLCIQTGHKLSDPDRFRFNTDKLYFASGEEMLERFSDVSKEAVSNTLEVFEKVNLEIPMGEILFPKATVPEGQTPEDVFVKEAKKGLEKRLKDLEEKGLLAADKEIYRKRLEMELEVIIEKGYASYFLIVSDFIKWAKSRGIPVGPGRGSAAGALTSYALGITNIDPIRWGLLFERFLNKERPSLPDIDVDFCMERREEVIDYVTQKYGKEYIAKIATFGQLKARQVIRDVGRVLGFKPKDIDPIAKMVTPGPDVSLEEELKREEFQKLKKESKEISELFDLALKLERLPRHVSQHAAGVIISGKPIVEVAPLMKLEEGEQVVQFDMKSCEAVGLIKFDFLGLKTLTIIDYTLKLIKNYEGVEIDLDNLPLDDPKTFELLQKGETDGVFQLESEGMKNLLRKLKPTDFNDIIAVLALYRPGPLKGGLVDQYIETKHGLREPEYLHPLLEPILKETYGVIVYQEQIMEIARAFAGYTLGEADLLRRAVGKKDKELMKQLKDEFIERSVKRGISEQIASQIFDLIEKFADYGFNKSHSAAYAMVAYQTAYLKAHYPIYFMTALLTYEINNSEKISKYLSLAHEMGIKILPPDINKSEAEFTVENNAIRIGLQAIKNVGLEAVQEIIRKRPYMSFQEFCQKVDTHKINKKTMEYLIKAGAFDSLEPNRAKLLHNLSSVLSVAGQTKIGGLFAQKALLKNMIKLEDVPEWDIEEKLRFEKEALGFYLSDHPVKRLRNWISLFSPYNIEKLKEDAPEGKIILAGIVGEIKKTKATKKNGERIAIVKIEDEFSSVDGILFPEAYKKALPFISEGKPLWFKGTFESEEGKQTFLVEDVEPVESLRFFKDKKLVINLLAESVEEKVLEILDELFTRDEKFLVPKIKLIYPDCEVLFELEGKWIDLKKETLEYLNQYLQGGYVEVK